VSQLSAHAVLIYLDETDFFAETLPQLGVGGI
jgi:hypothetical protein